MALTITHSVTATGVNNAADQVSVNAWNANHSLSGSVAFSEVTGTISGSQLPNPSASTLGGVQSKAAVTSNWLTSISTSGVPAASQPAFSDISGNISTSQMASGASASATTFFCGDGTWQTPASGGTPGGSNTQVQFNNSSAFGGDSGFTYGGSGQATLALGTITTNKKALNITATWNASGVTFDAPLFMNVTNTASHSGSLLMDLQIGGTTFAAFGISNGGANPTLWLSSATPTDLNYNLLSFSGNTYYNTPNGGAHNFVVNNGGIQFAVTNGKVFVGISAGLVWENAAGTGVAGMYWQTASGSNGILGLVTANTLTNPTALWTYNTTDSATLPANYERGGFDWTTTANTFRIRSDNAGTGTNRIITIDGFDKAGAAANTDLPSGTWALIHDTSGATVKLVYNLSGTLKTVALV